MNNTIAEWVGRLEEDEEPGKVLKVLRSIHPGSLGRNLIRATEWLSLDDR